MKEPIALTFGEPTIAPSTGYDPLPLHARRARSLIHISGQGPVCSISVSANHVHEDYTGCKRDFIARQDNNAERIIHTWNCHDELTEALAEALSLLENGDTVPVWEAGIERARRALDKAQHGTTNAGIRALARITDGAKPKP